MKDVNKFGLYGMKLKEIATQEGVSVDAVKSWGREARRKLRDRIEEGNLPIF